MKKDYVYLCGGMEGYSKEKMSGWRAKATKFLDLNGIETLDPTRRFSFHSGFQDRNAVNRVVKMDLQDISNSTVLLCDMRYNQPGKRWGSMAEIAHAHTKNKIIIVWTDEDDIKHPFLEFYATEIHHTLKECVEAIVNYY
jgi:hypothetical protein